MDLALFDLDNTLIKGDSDYEWGRYLCEANAPGSQQFETKNRQFYDDYCAGKLDISAYLQHSLSILAQNDMQQLLLWRKSFIKKVIEPMLKPAVLSVLERHRREGALLVIISSTNRFIVEPIAELFGIREVIATDVEIINDQFSGELSGIACFQDGKITKLKQWLDAGDIVYKESYFYSDSINDLPLLEWVDCPVVVDGDERLLALAQERGWQVITT